MTYCLYSVGAQAQLGRISPKFSQMGEQNLGPNSQEILSQMGEHFSTKPCAGLGVHLPVIKIIKVCSMDSSDQITLIIHRLLQNFTVYCLSNWRFVVFFRASA